MLFDVDDPAILPYRVFERTLEAPLYNTIRLGILRDSNPLIFDLDSPPNIKCHLDDHKWVLIDTVHRDYPLVVWRDFSSKNRGLHETVDCKVHVYHIMAGRVMGTALYAMEDYINNTILNKHR